MARHDELDRFRKEMEEAFADLCQVPRLVTRRRAFRPRVDVFLTDDPPTITVVAELAGVEPDDVDLSVADGVLVLTGHRHRVARPPVAYQHIELDYGPFERRVPLAQPVDADRVEAVYDRGLLRVTLPVVPPRSRKTKVDVTTRRAG
jgi:HSP20 family protein